VAPARESTAPIPAEHCASPSRVDPTLSPPLSDANRVALPPPPYSWQSPGAFANGFKGVCAVFVTAAFSFAGTELVGLAASETPNPRKTMPSAGQSALSLHGR
jgi:amino acid transporter